MYRPWLLLPILACLSLLVFAAKPATPASAALAPIPTPSAAASSEAETELVQAIQAAILSQNEAILAFLVYTEKIENIHLSSDDAWATALLVLIDPATQEPVPGEPGLVAAHRVDGNWHVYLPADPEWSKVVQQTPDEVLSAEHKAAWLEALQDFQATLPTAPLTGYYLPWAAGERRYLSQSVYHDRYIPSGSAHYAFDFYVPETAWEVWNIYAAKGGVIWKWKTDTETCYEYSCADSQPLGNYVVIQDPTTIPASYQVYLHMAQESLPVGLRAVGAPVARGQFIGLADNTGQSWGSHLHFQVHENPNSYWGQSVDITFIDVPVNGGRPRTSVEIQNKAEWCHFSDFPPDVCNDYLTYYTSQNVPSGDIAPPSGDLFEPVTGGVITSNSLYLSGWALDLQSGLASAQFIAQYNDAWHNIGPVFTEALFTYTWDVCADDVPAGPVSVALRLVDQAGNIAYNLPGLAHVSNEYACPAAATPACLPQSDEIAVFAEYNYSGACVVLPVGDYPTSDDLGSLGEDNAASIQVGADVRASLFSDGDYSGRAETFSANDSNLSDNLIGSNLLSSLRVLPLAAAPAAPPSLVAPAAGSAFPGAASLSLSWRAPASATEFQASLAGSAQLTGPSSPVITTSTWLNQPVWHLEDDLLPGGTYTWTVQARNPAGSTGWSAPFTFTIGVTDPLPAPETLPFFDDVEGGTNGWTASGLWNRLDDPDNSQSPSHSWYYGEADGDYQDGNPNSGDLTSPPLILPASGEAYVLSFWYKAVTENSANHWDQRWVQISANNGPFENVAQLSDDLSNWWLHPQVDLSPYAGQTIQVRFHFETLDRAFNKFAGWYIDDISVQETEPVGCQPDGNDTPVQAVEIAYGATQAGEICAFGDVDYFKFQASAGDRIAVDITSTGNPLPTDMDPILFLFDGDGLSTLAVHDDEVLGVQLDPHLGYYITRAGTYYLKLRLWSYPSSGGLDYSYTIKAVEDKTAPQAAFTYPTSGSYLGNGEVTFSLTASDSGSGVGHVQFLWHSSDWLFEEWTVLGEDWKGSDGWSITFDTTDLPEQNDAALYAHVYDWAGNWRGLAAWSLGSDHTPPATALEALPPDQASTAVLLQWTGSDDFAGLEHYDLQYSLNGVDWLNYSPDPGGNSIQAWFIGQENTRYGFKIRGVDRAGNSEPFPMSEETYTFIPDGAELCPSLDEWETDNSPAQAQPIYIEGQAQIHNLCNPALASYAGDQDWLTFTATVGRGYRIESFPLVGSAAVQLKLYASDQITLLASAAAPDFDKMTRLVWTSDRSGPVYVQIQSINAGVTGSEVQYQIALKNPVALLLPIIK